LAAVRKPLEKVTAKPPTRKKIKLTRDEALSLLHAWKLEARQDQLEPLGAWLGWLILAGRGYGKTRTGAEWIRDGVTKGICGRIALVAEDAGDARDVMIDGESGILAISNPRFRPTYVASKRRLTWPNGARATVFSDKDCEALRGPQHDRIWFDELAKFPNQESTFNNAMFGLRLGKDPRWAATTTPRPTKLIRQLIASSDVVVTRGTSYENLENLAASYKFIIKAYEGTRLGRQELNAEMLSDTPGALWTLDLIDSLRRPHVSHEDMEQIVVGVDPMAKARTQKERDDLGLADKLSKTGIVVCGSRIEYTDGEADRHGYTFDDLSLHGKPNEWGKAVVRAYYEYNANYVVAEANNGGDMVQSVIEAVDSSVPVKLVHASRGKYTRAEPISAHTEKGLVHHVKSLTDLEDQMTTWVPGDNSPDNMDAMVWALTELLGTALVDLSRHSVESEQLTMAAGPGLY